MNHEAKISYLEEKLSEMFGRSVEVADSDNGDDDWAEPVYASIDGTDAYGLCDIASDGATIDEQVAFLAEQLREGLPDDDDPSRLTCPSCGHTAPWTFFTRQDSDRQQCPKCGTYFDKLPSGPDGQCVGVTAYTSEVSTVAPDLVRTVIGTAINSYVTAERVMQALTDAGYRIVTR